MEQTRGTRTAVFDFIFWPFKVNSAFWRGRALHSIVVTSPWPGEEHSREVANSNEKREGGRKVGFGWQDQEERLVLSHLPCLTQHCSTCESRDGNLMCTKNKSATLYRQKLFFSPFEASQSTYDPGS